MYVPGAREERTISHRLAVGWLDAQSVDTELWRLSNSFHHPPLIVDVIAHRDIDDEASRPSSWAPTNIDAPSSGLELIDGHPALRLFNTSHEPIRLPKPLTRLTLRGEPDGTVDQVLPGEIVTIDCLIDPPTTNRINSPALSIEVAADSLPPDRVGPNRARPSTAQIESLQDHLAALIDQVADAADLVTTSSGDERYRAIHHELVLDREAAEVALSLELNRRRAHSEDVVSIPDEADDEITRLGTRLNDLRIRRRIYDYVVQSL